MVISPPDNTQRLMPRLMYIDAPAAIEFLCRAFGFQETARFAPGGKLVYSEIALNGETLFAIGTSHGGAQSPQAQCSHSIQLFCYIDDVDCHYAQARAAGATILNPQRTNSGAIAPMRFLIVRAFAGHSAS
jgi:uncharacterized glyoxalase superfamily protein PhnB